MSPNQARTHRRAVSPPAVTRFHLRTASAAEAVFSPPYVPDHVAAALSRVSISPYPAPPPIHFPEPQRSLRAPEPTVAAPQAPDWLDVVEDLEPVESAPAASASADVIEEQSAEAGPTWREIIARIDVDDGVGESASAPVETVETAPAEVAPPEAEPAPSVDIPAEHVSWEFSAMTTPEYTAPRSVDALEDVPAAPAEHEVQPTVDETLDAGDEDTEPDGAFPLNAFIVPGGVHHVPAGYESEVARLVAMRLDELAQQLRSDGLAALGRTHSADELSRVLAAIVTGYVAADGGG